MANNQIGRILEFANLQMAAESFLIEGDEPSVPENAVSIRLARGNTHASAFPNVLADQIAAQYEVLVQYRNDPLKANGTGFSGTLLRNRQSGELTLSFRSTEFIDDAVRDTHATNALEIADLGWALGQIAEMEKWYAELRSDPNLLGGKNFNVTGYSLGGHLATAFNILRREEFEDTGDPESNPVINTITFNGAGTGAILDNRRLTDLVADFNRIRMDYTASDEWRELSIGDQNTVRALAQSRVEAIRAEEIRVSKLSSVTRAFDTSAPTGDHVQLGYQIAALLVAQATVGAFKVNQPTINGPLVFGSELKSASEEKRFPNMIEIVGMEKDGNGASFVSNSGIHYGTRILVPIEGQPLFRGLYPLTAAITSALEKSVKLLVNNPDKNDFGDTHSLVLLVDSLAVMATMEQLDPSLTIETASEIFRASSKAGASLIPFPLTQGKAEGDTLELTLESLRTLVQGPGQAPILRMEEMREALNGNTWHLDKLRGSFHQELAALSEIISERGLTGSLKIESLVGASSTDLTVSAISANGLAYRYALKELNPFAALSESDSIYTLHNLRGGLDLYDAVTRTGSLTPSWIGDRAAMLEFLNAAYTNNTNAVMTNLVTDQIRYTDSTKRADGNNRDIVAFLPGGLANFNGPNTRRIQFGSETPDFVIGRDNNDRLYGGAGSDWLEGGKGSGDYLEGGSGRDIYSYTAEKGPLLPDRNDGADTIVDTDGQGTLRYVYRDSLLSGWQSTVTAGIGINFAGTQWSSADGRFNYSIAAGSDDRVDLHVSINGQTGARIDLTDYRDNDFGITLRNARGNHQYAPLGPVLSGDDSPNTLIGSAFADVVQGLGAGDALSGNAGDDLILGGPEDDFEFGNEGFDRLLGETGRDQLFGGADDDELNGGADSDYMEGGAGSDRLAGDAGRDIALGGEGNDEIYAGNLIYEHARFATYVVEAETQKGTGLQGDWLEGNEGKDILVGERDDDLLAGGADADILVGGAGDDNLVGDANGASVRAEWTVRRIPPTGIPTSGGTYRLEYLNALVMESPDGAGDELRGGAGADWLFGGLGKDVLYGDAGADVVFGQQDADMLVGGAGNDVLVGDDPGVVSGAEEGGDYLDGGAGDDVLQGNGGDDILIGGPGNDSLHGGAGKDTYFFNKGDGADVVFDDSTGLEKSELIYGEGFDRTKLTLREGSLILDFGDGDATRFVNFDVNDPNSAPTFETLHFADGDTMSFGEVIALGFDLEGTEGDDNGQTASRPILAGTAFSDRIRGHLGSDFLAGLQGDDILDGGEDSDRLQGDEGNDALYGGAGNDVLFGGAGDDTLAGDAGFDFLNGGEDNDTYFFDPQDSVLDLAGSETIAFGEGFDPEDIDLSIQTFNGQPIRFIALAGDDAVHAGMGVTLGLDGLSRTVNYRFSGDLVLTEEEIFRTSRIDSQQFSGSVDDDVIFGYAGADLLRGMDGNDYLFGGRGDDLLEGGSGDDTLVGDAGNDRLSGGLGADVLTGGKGGDQLAGQSGSDTYQFARGDGQDLVIDDGDAGDIDVLRLDGINPGDLYITREASGDLRISLVGTDDVVTVSDYYNDRAKRIELIEFADGSIADSSLLDALTVPFITGTETSDTLAGTQYDDTLLGLEGDDVLNGNFGNDVLHGGSGDDQLNGGGGLDQLIGGIGEDTYVISLTPGESTLIEDGAEQSFIKLPGGLAYSDLTAQRSGDELVLEVRDTDSRTVIPGYYTGQTNWTVTTATCEFRTLTDLVAYLDQVALPRTVPELEQDYLQEARRKYQLYLESSGASGGVNVNEQPVSDAQNISRLAPFGETELNGEFFLNIARINGGDSANVVHLGFQGVNIVDSGGGDDIIYNRGFGFVDGANSIGSFLYGNNGNDQIVGTFNTDVIIGGAGSDYLNGDDGSDIFHVDPSQAGVDLIDEVTNARLSPAFTTFAAGAADRIVFSGGLTAADISLSWDGFSYTDSAGAAQTRPVLNISWSDGRGIRVVVPVAGDHPQAGVEHFQFTDGTVWTLDQFLATAPLRPTILGGQLNDVLFGTFFNDTISGGAGNDQIHADSGNDVIDGGAGDDTLDGWFGNDTFLFGYGSGRDVIQAGLMLPPPPPLPGLPPPPLGPAFSDTLSFLPGVFASDVRVQKVGADLVISLDGALDQVTIQNWFSIPEVANFVFADGGAWNLNDIHAQLPVAAVMGTEGNDFLSGTLGRDELYGLGGDDSLTGSGNPDVLDGGAGNDLLAGGSGSDTYLFGRGYGLDRIDPSGSLSGETETVKLAPDISPSDLDISFDHSTLYLAIGGDDQLTLNGALNNPSRISYQLAFSDGTVWDMRTAVANGALIDAATNDQRVDSLGIDNTYVGGAGNDLLDGGHGSDWLDGGSGDDTLKGGAGDDIYVFGRGYGDDTIEQGSGDVLRLLPGVSPSDIGLTRNGSDLRMSINDTTDGLTIRGWWGANAPDRVEFGNGITWNAATLSDLTASLVNNLSGSDAGDQLSGTAGIDFIRGKAGSDSLFGDSGDDILHGAEGNDRVAGGPGNDTYIFERGDGHDEIVDFDAVSGAVDVVRFGAGIEPADVSVIQGPYSHLYVSIVGTCDRLDLFFPDDKWGIERFQFADGSIWEGEGITDRLSPGTPTQYDDPLGGMDSDDRIDGQDGGDIIFGGGGDDILLGGAGNDDVVDWAGNNLIDGGAGDDYLFVNAAPGGVTSTGRNFITGGAGNDLIDSYGVSNVIAFNAGDGEDTIYAWDKLTVSLGGGIKVSSLSLSKDGHDLVLSLGAGDSIRFSRRFDENPEAWPQITLQLFGSVHIFDFNAVINEFYQALIGNPSLESFALGDVLPAHQTLFSETQALGDALAHQYGIHGTLAMLDDEITRQMLRSEEFGAEPQSIAVEVPNQAPSLSNPIADRLLLEDSKVEFSLPEDTFSDVEPDGLLQLTAALADGTPLPGWMVFNANSREFSVAPSNDHVGGVDVRLTATDSGGLSASDTFHIEVAGVNDSPVLVEPVADLKAEAGQPFAWTIPTESFGDPDIGDALHFAAELETGATLPAWLEFDPATRSFSGTPSQQDAGVFTVRLTASDVAGAAAVDTLNITVEARTPGIVLIGTPRDDALQGGAFDDTLSGRRGNDAIYGDAGNDYLLGGDGKDSVNGGAGDDLIAGGAGHDVLSDAEGWNIFIGGKGHDELEGGSGTDLFLMNLGDGKDRIRWSATGNNADLDVLSLGGGATCRNVSLRRDREDLLVEAGGEESQDEAYARVILSDWYAGGSARQTIAVLQLFEDGVASVFDFKGLAREFDGESQERLHTERWFVAAALPDVKLGAGGEPLGGALAMNYAATGVVPGDDNYTEDGARFARQSSLEDDSGQGAILLHEEQRAVYGQATPVSSRREQKSGQHPVSELLDRYLSSQPHYDFEMLMKEQERPDAREDALSTVDIARRWRMVSRYALGLPDEEDENARGGADGQWPAGRDLLGGLALSGGFGHSASTGEMPGLGLLKRLQGLDEGFRRLHS